MQVQRRNLNFSPLPLSGQPGYTRPGVNRRSVALGICGVLAICGLTPYNDLVLSNTTLIGGYLPIGILILMPALILCINAPLHRWMPTHALRQEELGVALGMMLVGCALPASGLMRYLPTSLVGIWHHAGPISDYQAMLRDLHLPDWMFPTFESSDPLQRTSDPIVQQFYGRMPTSDPTFPARWSNVPWAAWFIPAMTWGVLFAAIYSCVLCLSTIVRTQWVDNERLAFPLATVYLSLIEDPAPGRCVNSLLRAPFFWLAFAAVFCVHAINGLAEYFPKLVPPIPLGFNFVNLLADTPFRHLDHYFKSAQLFFIVIGVTFFVQTKLAFSLWFVHFFIQFQRMIYGSYEMTMTGGMWIDQLFGGCVAFAAIILWLGRKHWAMVARQMFNRVRPNEATGRYLSNRIAGWGFLISIGIVVAWLTFAGMTVIGAIVLVAILLLIYLVLARLIAETGLLYGQVLIPPWRPWSYLLNVLPVPIRTTSQNYFFSTLFQGMLTYDLRESSPVYSLHAMRIADGVTKTRSDAGWRFIAALGFAMGVGFLVSGAASLYCHYSFSTTLEQNQQPPDYWGKTGTPRDVVLWQTSLFTPPGTGPADSHNRAAYFGYGLSAVAILSVLHLRFVNFPLHPIGFLLADSSPIGRFWLSIMIGWLAKSIILRLFGANGLRIGRFPFMGMIFGEAAAAGFWLIVSLILNATGQPYHSIRILPT